MLWAAVWMLAVVGAFFGGVNAYRYRDRLRAMISRVQGGEIIQTNLYNIAVAKVSLPAEGRDGGIAALGDGLLFINRLGAAWYVDAEKTLQPLTLTVPINVAEFEADPYNVNTDRRQQFAVKDILIQSRPEGIRLLASYNFWYADRDCYVLRVSLIETSLEELLAASPEINRTWRQVFETVPCRALTANPNGVNRNPTLGAGGRLAAWSDQEILVTVGGFGPESVEEGDSVLARNRNTSYGKTILFNVETGKTRILTVGHRNPQGLAISADSQIWLTEHAARGGDELNRIIDGRDYGYPMVSYGTEYESMVWSLNARQGRHDGFEKPIYAWVPSIGISQVAVIEKPLFGYWLGDVIVSSLRARSLFRVRIDDGRAVVVEPIPIGHRIRDLAELADGTLALKSDADFLIYLRPLNDASATDPTLPPTTRGQLLAGACTGCHTFDRDSPDGIAPSLWNVVGRRIASRPYQYSTALRSLRGSWTPDLLRRFLLKPDSVAPGTAMALTTIYTPEQLDDLIAYLETLR